MKIVNNYLHSMYDSKRDASESIDGILNDFSLIIPDGMEDVLDDPVGRIGFNSLISDLVDILSGGMPEFVSFFLLLFGCAVLVLLVGQLGDGISAGAKGGVSVSVGAVILIRLFPLLTSSADMVREVGEFFSLLIPIISGGAALSGGAVAASSLSGMTVTASFIGGATSLLFPLVGASMIVGVLSAISSDVTPAPLDGIRKNLVRVFGIISAVIGGLFSLQTSVASVRDGATIRALRYAVGNTIPVVGGVVSGTLSTLGGGLGYAMGVIGGGGVAVMLSLALSPILELLLYRLAFFVVGLFLDLFPATEGTRVISALAGGLDALIGTLSLSVAVYMLEAVLVMKGVVSIL